MLRMRQQNVVQRNALLANVPKNRPPKKAAQRPAILLPHHVAKKKLTPVLKYQINHKLPAQSADIRKQKLCLLMFVRLNIHVKIVEQFYILKMATVVCFAHTEITNVLQNSKFIV